MCDCSFGDPENPETSKTEETNKLSFPPFLFFSQTLFLRSPSLHIPTIHLHLIRTFYAKPFPPSSSTAASDQNAFSLPLSRDNFVSVSPCKNVADMFFSPPRSPFLVESQTRLLRGDERKRPPFLRHLRDGYEMGRTNGRPRLERCGKFNSTSQVFSSKQAGIFPFDVCRPTRGGAARAQPGKELKRGRFSQTSSSLALILRCHL